MVDIFGRSPMRYGGGYRHDHTTLTLNLPGGFTAETLGMIVQRFAVAYQKRVTKVFEFGNNNFYYVEGPPDGTMQIDNLVGPKGLVLAFAKHLGDVCKAIENTVKLTINAGCAGENKAQAKPTTLTMANVLCDSISITGEAQSAMIQAQTRMSFGSFDSDQ